MKRLFSAVLAVLFVAAGVGPVRADTAPPSSGTPTTVTADPLPTVQVNGVVWSQVVVGNRVYAGGSFSKARPAGSAPGQNEVTRNNLLAYDIRTGNLITSFAPSLNGQVLAVTKSPDGSRVYVGGQFTSVSGQNRYRIAAFDAASGNLIGSFAPAAGTTVRAITATNSTVYFGGDFHSVSGTTRMRVAAASASNGQLTSWNPGADRSVTALTMNPAKSLVVVGGRFTTLAGVARYGIGAVDAGSGAARTWQIESVVRTAGVDASITSLVADGDAVYGTAYTYGSGGNFEGTFRADGGNGALEWISDCHGDHYSTWPAGDVVYNASHAHYCGNIDDGFQDTNPRSYYHSTALTNSATAANDYNALYGLESFDGRPSPSLLHWYPVWSVGSYTGQTQAGWHITGNSDYVVVGGEFPAVNGQAQQGLVRFTRNSPASNTTPPQRWDSLKPAAVSMRSGEVSVGWQATFDRDNRQLQYDLLRGSTVINTQQVSSTPWRRPTITFTDAGRPPGSTQQYRVRVTDPHGRTVTGDPTSVTVSGSSKAYGATVLASDPEHWFRLNEGSGSTVRDSRGSADATGPASLSRNISGALNDGDSATRFPGNSNGYVATEVSQRGPQVVSVEAWVKTSTNSGGRIVGFGDRKEGVSKSGWTDRHLYMDNQGRIIWGVDNGSKQRATSGTGFNDNQWHHIVGTLGPDGQRLYVDGKQVAANSGVRAARDMQGHWRIGGDTLSGWGSKPSSEYFSGSVDEIAIYHRVLSAAEVDAHYQAASGGAAPPPPPPVNAVPVASFSSSVDGLAVSVDGRASSDPDGSVVSHAWDFGDGASGSGSTASHTYGAAGTYTVRLTVTDNQGATGSATRSVTVADPGEPPPEPPAGAVAADAFGRTVAGGWGSADVGGAWSVGGGSQNFSVDGSAGLLTVPAAGRSASAFLNGVSALDQDLVFTWVPGKVADGGGTYLNAVVRGDRQDGYRAKVRVLSGGSVRVQLVRVINGGQTTLATADVPGLSVAAGAPLRVRLQAVGASPAQLAAKVWAAAGGEPSGWAVQASDGTAALQSAGGLGLFVYVSGSASNTPITYRIDDLDVAESR